MPSRRARSRSRTASPQASRAARSSPARRSASRDPGGSQGASSPEIVAIGEKYKADAIEQAKVDAKAEADRIVAAAKAEIEQEVARAKESLRDAVADLAVAGATQILKRDVDRAVHAQLARAARRASCSAVAELTTIARPYAEAAFALAREQNALPAWSQMLKLASGIVADPQMAAALDNPRLDAPAKESLLLSIAGDRLNARGPQFRARPGRGRPHRADADHLALFETLKDARRRRGQGHDRDGLPARRRASSRELTAALERRFKRKIEAEVIVKPELIGGARITVGDNVIDGTVQERLRAMASSSVKCYGKRRARGARFAVSSNFEP